MRTRLQAGTVGLAALALAALGAPAPAGAEDGRFERLAERVQRTGSERVVIALERRAQQSPVIDRLERAGAEVLHRYRALPYLLAEVGPDAISALADERRVVAAQRDVPVPATLDSTIPLINADDAAGLGFDGDGAAVAILDSGIDADHPFLGSPSRVVAQACFSNAAGAGGKVSLCPNGTPSQTSGDAADALTAECLDGAETICEHGTHVAGITAGDGTGVAGAPAQGVAPAAEIVAIQVFTRFEADADCSGPGTAPCVRTFGSDQIRGLEHALALRQTLGSRLVAANMSFGSGAHVSPCDGDTRKPAIDALRAAGVASVISAGNDNQLNAVAAPGCISSAVTVGSTSDADAVFNNRGPLLDLFAPGINVTSSLPSAAFASRSGTSMSAPHVAGAYAVLSEALPGASEASILHWLQQSGEPVSYDIDGGPGTTIETTPRIDLTAALDLGAASPQISVDDAAVTVDEGATATATGEFSEPQSEPVTLSASAGAVVDEGGGQWSWSLPTSDGPAQSQTATITATDSAGNDSPVTVQVEVRNVAPDVGFGPGQAETIARKQPLQLLGEFADPGYDDTYQAEVSWGDGASTDPAATVTTPGPPVDLGEVDATHTYDRAGTYELELEVGDDDSGVGEAQLTVTVVPRCGGEAPTIVGTDAGELLEGTAGDDVIYAGRGADTVRGEGGEDVICGANGEDVIRGRSGDDRLLGQAGDDDLAGGGGSDELIGGPGADRCSDSPGSTSFGSCESKP